MARKPAYDSPVPKKSRSRASSSSKAKPAVDNIKLGISFRCYSFSHISKSHCEDGNKIIMPESILVSLLSKKKIKQPYTFEITNPLLGKVSHCGVLEFTAAEGIVCVPDWMMKNLMILQQGAVVNIKYTSLTKGTYLKIQPHQTEFVMNLSDPKDVMERIMMDFACVTIGDTIMVNHQNQSYYIDIVKTEPTNVVSLIKDTEIELDFEKPLDYKEPDQQMKPKEKQVEGLKDAVNLEKKDAVFKPFTGVARRLDGQVTATPVVADENDHKKLVVASRKHGRTGVCDSDDHGSADNMKRGKAKVIEDVKEKAIDNNQDRTFQFQPFTGRKYTLQSV